MIPLENRTPALVIVRDEATLYRIRASDEIPERAILVIDRRVGERRRHTGDGSVERRRYDRRSRLDITPVVNRAGFAVIDAIARRADLDDALA